MIEEEFFENRSKEFDKIEAEIKNLEHTVTINKIDWSIQLSNDLNENLFGDTDYALHLIRINNNCCKNCQERALLHELTHAYCYSFGLIYKEKYNREELCEFISHNAQNLIDLFNKGKRYLK